MSEFRLSPEADLDRHWLYIARESSSIDIANRLIDSISSRFWLLAEQPFLGRSREKDLRPGLRSFPVGDYVIIYRIEEDDAILILQIPHSSRDIINWLTH